MITTTVEQIRTRVEQSGQLWNTIWLDGQVAIYPLTDSVKPVEVKQFQLWQHRDLERLVIIGQLGGDLEVVFLQAGGQQYQAVPVDDLTPFTPIRNEVNGQVLSTPDQLSLFVILRILVSHSEMAHFADLRMIRRELLAGRKTLVIDAINSTNCKESRSWVDQITGIILRQQQYGGKHCQSMIWEYAVDEVVYDANLPPELFDPHLPWRGRICHGLYRAPDVDRYHESPCCDGLKIIRVRIIR